MTVEEVQTKWTLSARKIAFDETFAALPKHFAQDGDVIVSHFAAVLSAFFPDGEDFFVRSVRHFRRQIDDPELRQKVTAFIGQESTHGHEHRALNDRLGALGYPTKRIERMTRIVLGLRERLLSARANLAATAALEHFTATIAEQLLTDSDSREALGDEAVRNLFLWHALEEAEHKAVAFDVYRAVGGSERTRVMTMKVIRAAFLLDLIVQTILSLLGDPAIYRGSNLNRSWRRLRRSELVSVGFWRRLCDYDRPGFHPDDRDVTELVQQWRSELFGPGGSLTARLESSPAP